MNEKSRDQHARRRLRRIGLEMYKARPRGQRVNPAPYLLIDPNTSTVFAGPMSIEQVEAWLVEAEGEDEE